MALPTPSFFRIRLNILIIGFVVLYFVVGVFKDVFAGDTWETSNERWVVVDLANYNSSQYPLHDSMTVNWNTGVVSFTVTGGSYPKFTGFNYAIVQTYYCNDQGVKYQKHVYGSIYAMVGSNITEQNVGRSCSPVPCPNNAKRDDITGECPCTGELTDGQETYEESSIRCSNLGQTLLFYSTQYCSGVCIGSNNGPPPTCSR